MNNNDIANNLNNLKESINTVINKLKDSNADLELAKNGILESYKINDISADLNKINTIQDSINNIITILNNDIFNIDEKLNNQEFEYIEGDDNHELY